MNKSSINFKELQRLLIFYSVAEIFIISILVAIVSILPLYKQLKINEESNLQSALKTRTLGFVSIQPSAISHQLLLLLLDKSFTN